ncbi:MAG: ABC transporter permease subunit [Candidatus Riflebacteria bacterium]|nr:ABC transporter permease subunit [Candidatus Riflebacteria bacterium]
MPFRSRSRHGERAGSARLRSFLVLLVLPVLGVAASAARADQLELVRRTGILRWGADAEGGAPYVCLDPRDKTRLVGFEVEVAAALAAKLGVQARMVQNDWKSLLPGLDTNNYDVALNGIEITPDRAHTVEFTQPYYLSTLQLSVRREDPDLPDLRALRGKKVGTLEGSLAERLLQAMDDVQVLSFPGQHTPYMDLANGRCDAVLQDYPIALYYGKPNPRLKFTGDAGGEVRYGVACKKGEVQLARALNVALDDLARRGVLRSIYERWGLWNEATGKYFGDRRPSGKLAPAYEEFLRQTGQLRTLSDRFADYVSSMPILLRGALTTLGISSASMALAIVVGIALALLRLYGPRPLSVFALLYVELVRGTPLLIQLYLLYYGLPNLGIQLSPLAAAWLGLGLNYAASESENYRAGILSVPHGQMEAALALGMTPGQAIRHIIMPQAVRIALPPVTNDFLALLKDSSLVSVITMVELTKVYGQLAATYNDYIVYGLITAAIYFVMGLPFVRLARVLEQRLAVAYRHA